MQYFFNHTQAAGQHSDIKFFGFCLLLQKFGLQRVVDYLWNKHEICCGTKEDD